MRRLAVIPMVLVMMIAFMGSSAPDSDEAEGRRTLYRQMNSLTQFDPIYIEDSTFYAASNIFSLLFRLQGQDSQMIPDLATSWEFEDETNIVFTLRQGVMWQDGNDVFPEGQSREVVADDVVYSLLRQVQTEDAAPPADLRGTFESVEAIDDYTVRITLSAPNAMLFSRGRGLTKTAIVPREAVEYYGDDFSFNPIGSGPFEFVEYRPDDRLVLRANEDYWIEPNLDEVVYRVIPDNEAALIAFENGEVDILWQVPPAELARLSSDSDFQIFGGGCPVQAQIIFNVMHPILGEIRVREAISRALDGDAINANVMGGMAISGAGTAGPGVPGYVDDLYERYFAYDPEQAEAILDSLGWVDSDGDGIRDKDGEDLAFSLEVFSSDTNAQFGAAIVTQLQEVGMDVTLETVETGTYVQDIMGGAQKAYLMTGWCGEGGTSSLWGRNAFGSALGVSDETAFSYIEQANNTMDRELRDELLQQATERIYSLYWGSCLGFHDFFTSARSYVKDFGGTLWHENLVTEINNVSLEF